MTDVFEKHGKRIAKQDARMPKEIRDVLSPPPAKPVKPLTPPDFKQCQTEITTTAPFMQMGGSPKTTQRCTNKPTMLVTEDKPGKDGQIGSMTLCDGCYAVMQKQVPAGVSYRRITAKDKKHVRL